MRRLLVITELTRDVGWRPAGLPAKVVNVASEGRDYFAIPLTWRSFRLDASDYDIIADEAVCPCGATVGPDDVTLLGSYADAAEAHIAEAHPGVRTR